MITNEQAAKMFEQPTIEAVPTDMKRIIIPAYGFAGARDASVKNGVPTDRLWKMLKVWVSINRKIIANRC